MNYHLDNFTLRGTFMADAPTDQVGQITIINPPDTEKYYWAFDPAGLDQLTHEAAEDIGLPTAEFWIQICGVRWDECEDDMIRDFHVAQGFDPCRQDVAIAKGYPLIDMEEMKNFNQRGSKDCPDTGVGDGIYYSHGLC
ncbi:hypothetical protein B0H13DRAFT_1872882 [Mycena leptocephala]|nr:hypothetical protein B0H13DRAFT_1872882 [Mycena leptocephala]